MSLTTQQRLYAEARFSGLSKKDSALAAGCPEKTAAQAGSRLERHPNVVAHLARLKANESDTVQGSGKDAPPPNLSMGAEFFDDPLVMLRHAMNEQTLDPKTRIQAATALLPYTHQKLGESGKKEKADEAAQGAVTGRFKPATPPQLSLIK